MDIPQDQVHRFICRNGHQFSRRSVYYATRVSLEIVVPSLFTKAPVAGFRQHWAVLDMATRATGEVNAFENPHFQLITQVGDCEPCCCQSDRAPTILYGRCSHPLRPTRSVPIRAQHAEMLWITWSDSSALARASSASAALMSPPIEQINAVNDSCY